MKEFYENIKECSKRTGDEACIECPYRHGNCLIKDVCFSDIAETDEDFHKLLNLITIEHEKQISKKPCYKDEIEYWSYEDTTGYVVQRPVCPTCGKELFFDCEKYCYNCGQKIDRSDENE